MTALFSLDGRIAVVTGGMGQLGRQYVLALSAAGARVVSIDVSDDAAQFEARSGVAADPARILLLQADILDRKALEAALARIEAAWGTPHILVNNAALDSPPDAPLSENGPFENYPEASWDRVMDVNAKGTMLCCQVFGGAMAKAGRGSIINVGSIYGVVSPNQSIYEYRRQRGEDFYKPVAYAASKSAVYNLTRYLAVYWATKNVRVNTVTLAGVYNGQDQEFLTHYLPKVPMGRMAKPEEYNGAILFLASDASSYMTGSNLVVDGGWTAW